jgi:mono/diheme cytochrome c family protein
MSIYFFKTLLSIVMVLAVFVNVFTMLEALGRGEKRYDVKKLKKIHRVNGFFFLLIFVFVSFYCFRSIIYGQMELSPRATFHSVLAIAVILLLALKISFLEIYDQFSNKVLVIGPAIALVALGMIGTSGGYYLLVTKFHTDTTFDEIREYKDKGVQQGAEDTGAKISIDQDAISKGKKIFEARCIFCHDAQSNNTIVGPGLKGVLKNDKLPVSKRPATPENIRNQLKEPFNKMPPFNNLTEEEIGDAVAFLNTL